MAALWGAVGVLAGGFVAWANDRLAHAEQLTDSGQPRAESGGTGGLAGLVWLGSPLRLGPPVLLGATLAALGGQLGAQAALLPRSLWAAVLVQVLFFDLARHLILDRVLLPAGVAAFLLSFVTPGVGWASSLAAGAGAICAFALIALAGRRALHTEAMGLGDVKLAGFIGLALGVQGATVALLAGVLLAGLVALGLVLTRVRGLRDRIAYGPYLALGSLLALFLAGLRPR